MWRAGLILKDTTTFAYVASSSLQHPNMYEEQDR